MQTDHAIFINDDQHVVLVANDEMRIHTVVGGETVTHHTGTLGTYKVPLSVASGSLGRQKFLSRAPIQLLPLSGGRGPVVNEGQTITSGLLKILLADVLTETELHPDLRNRLDLIEANIATLEQNVDLINADLADSTDIIDLINDELATAVKITHDPQTGYVTHNETINLDFTWPLIPPLIEMDPAAGMIISQEEDQGEIAIHYVEIPTQELVYGHTGVLPGAAADTYKFTAKAALLEYQAPVVNPVAWTSGDLSLFGMSAASQVTGNSSLESTSVPCMGFRIQGKMYLRNAGGTKANGYLYVQMNMDGAGWVDVARFKTLFEEGDTTQISKTFDVLMAADQSSHNYQFRGRLVLMEDDDPNRNIVGSVSVTSVTERGAGTILNNNIHLKWTTKE